MKTFIKFSIAILLLQAFFQTEIHAGHTYMFRISDKRTISYEQMITNLEKAYLVFVGETHDSESHHRFQLDIIKALNVSKTPIVVGFEMFTAESQNVLDQWVAGILPLENFLLPQNSVGFCRVYGFGK